MRKLPPEVYLGSDVVAISRALLGKFLFTRLPGPPSGSPRLTGGMIVETEAYAGPDDRASHAFGNRRTARTDVMFQAGGVAYVYLCYGMHALFNVVTNASGVPHAILVRALEPTVGIDTMLHRRGMSEPSPRLTAGPGSLTRALGITPAHTGTDLGGSAIWIEDRGVHVHPRAIQAGPRVGVAYAREHARLPWRFRIRNNPWTSPAR